MHKSVRNQKLITFAESNCILLRNPRLQLSASSVQDGSIVTGCKQTRISRILKKKTQESCKKLTNRCPASEAPLLNLFLHLRESKSFCAAQVQEEISRHRNSWIFEWSNTQGFKKRKAAKCFLLISIELTNICTETSKSLSVLVKKNCEEKLSKLRNLFWLAVKTSKNLAAKIISTVCRSFW